MNYVNEPAKRLEVIEDVDVLIIGGGPGGMPAAIAAARQGMNTMIVERYGFFGGLATAGLMGPLFGYATKGYKNNKLQLGGIPVEIVRGLQALGGAPSDDEIKWDAISFDPELYKHVCDRLVLDAGVRTLFHSIATNVIMNDTGDKIDYVVIESKSGRKAIKAKFVIDATGDGDVAVWAGEDFTQGRLADGLTQSLGTKFIIGGVSEKSHILTPEEREIIKDAIGRGEINCYQLTRGEVSDQGVTVRLTERTPTITRVKGDGTNVYDLTNGEFQLRSDSLGIVKFYREHIEGYENAYLQTTPAQIGVRETRQIKCEYTLTREDVEVMRRRPEDTIARGNWFFDIHCPRGKWSKHVEQNGMCSMKCPVEPECYMKTKYRDQMLETPWGFPRTYYDIPYGSIVPLKTKNLLVSGRCISADHYAMSSTRVIGTCLAIGEAAGNAAAIAISDSVSAREVDVKKIQKALAANNVPLGNNED